jgi:hypothetical protein
MQQEDELLRLRNYYHLGFYQNVINDVTSGVSQPRSEFYKLEQKTLLYRSYIGQHRFNVVLNELNPTTHSDLPNELKAVYYFGKYTQEANKPHAKVAEKQEAVDALKKLVEEDVAASVSAVEGSRLWMVELMAASALFQEGFLVDALKTLFGVKKNLET